MYMGDPVAELKITKPTWSGVMKDVLAIVWYVTQSIPSFKLYSE